MEVEGKPTESLSIEQGLEAPEYVLPSAHTIDHGILFFIFHFLLHKMYVYLPGN